MANAGFLGIGLLAYASWQAINFLNDRSTRVWAKQRHHRYQPRPSAESFKQGRSCSSCSSFEYHPEFLHSGVCHHHEWKMTMKSSEVMVKRSGHCELWHKILPRLQEDKELSDDQSSEVRERS